MILDKEWISNKSNIFITRKQIDGINLLIDIIPKQNNLALRYFFKKLEYYVN